MKRAISGACVPVPAGLLVLGALGVIVLWYSEAQRSAGDDAVLEPIHEDACCGRGWAVERALARGTPVDLVEDVTGRTPLICAAGSGRLDIVRLLLARGARVEASSPAYGTALSAATTPPNAPDLVRVLLEHGANPNSPNVQGVTPLMRAAMLEQDESAALLIAGGARVNEARPDGTTALMIAASCGDERIVRRLLAAGADARARDHKCRDAARLADLHGQARMAALLRRCTDDAE